MQSGSHTPVLSPLLVGIPVGVLCCVGALGKISSGKNRASIDGMHHRDSRCTWATRMMENETGTYIGYLHRVPMRGSGAASMRADGRRTTIGYSQVSDLINDALNFGQLNTVSFSHIPHISAVYPMYEHVCMYATEKDGDAVMSPCPGISLRSDPDLYLPRIPPSPRSPRTHHSMCM